jgi:predicted MFS family arabinose efflux permease
MATSRPPERPLPPTAAQTSSSTRTAAVMFAGFCAFLTLYAPQPLLPMLARGFHASAGAVSLVLTASTAAVALAAPFAGVVADRFGRKRVIVLSALLLSVPTAGAAASGSLAQMLAWRFWQGVFTPGIFAVTIAYVNDEWEQGVGAAMSSYVAGTVLGGFSGRMISALVAAHFSWRWSFIVLAALDALCAAAMWAWLPADRHFTRSRREASAPHAMLGHLRNPPLAATYAVGFCVLFTLIATFTYVNFYLAAPPFRLGTTALGLIFVVYLIGAVVTPVAGRAIDRIGHRFTLVAAFSAGVGGICLTLVPHLAAVLLGLALTSTGVFIAQSAASSYVGRLAEGARGAAVGLYVMFYYTGGSFGAAVPGWVWNRGGWPATVALIAAVQVLTIALCLLFWKAAAGPDGERYAAGQVG